MLPETYKYTLKHTTYYPALTDTNLSRTTVGVGEEVSFGFQPAMPYALDWSTSAGSVSPAFSSSTTLTSPSNAVSGLIVTAKLRGGKSVQFPPFTVVEPAGIDHAKITGTNSYPLGDIGAGMTNEIWIAPTDVSFYRVTLSELPCFPVNITGYFTNVSIGPVKVGSGTLGMNNDEIDQVYSGSFTPSFPIYPGGFDLYVTNYWHIGDTSVSNFFAIFPSSARILNSSGDASISKYGLTITRGTNDVSY